MATIRTRQKHTTGDIARAVGCDRLTVRRWLEAHGHKHLEGEQFSFEPDQFHQIVARMIEAHIRFPHHINRFEKAYGALNQRIPF